MTKPRSAKPARMLKSYSTLAASISIPKPSMCKSSRKGIVDLPPNFDVEVVGEFGNLRVVMPAPSLLVAAKLARGNARDVEDATWWMMERALTSDDIRTAIGSLPNPIQRETASENMVLVELVSKRSLT